MLNGIMKFNKVFFIYKQIIFHISDKMVCKFFYLIKHKNYVKINLNIS